MFLMRVDLKNCLIALHWQPLGKECAEDLKRIAVQMG